MDGKGLLTAGDGKEARAGDGKYVGPGEGTEMTGVQDNAPADLVSKLALGSQQDWVTKICKHYTLEEAEAEELVLVLVGGCDDTLGTDYEHAHGAIMNESLLSEETFGDHAHRST